MPKKKKCKICRDYFEPKFNSVQMVCSVKCGVEYSKIQREKKQKKDLKERKEELKTLSDHKKELEAIFNKFIRLRDKNKPCISCQKPLKKRFDAGHYRSKGGNPAIRFNEDNVQGQCVYCNRHLHGNLIDYRINLIKRIGLERVEFLEGHHEPKHYTIPEIIILKEVYKEKIKKFK